VATGEYVLREEGPLPGAVLARVATSHVRIGTFEYFARRGDTEGVRVLADYVIARLYPDAAQAENPVLTLLEFVVARTAELIARWQCVGFIHGVMNTDNTSIGGETIDYGPCAFMDAYSPSTVFSSIDHHGRYAYDQQPRIARWNLTRFAETLLPLLGEGEEAIAAAQRALDAYPDLFEAAYAKGLRAKLGFTGARGDDLQLIQDFFGLMAEERADFTLVFRYLCDSAEGNDARLRTLFQDHSALEAWLANWRKRLAVEETTSPIEHAARMRAVNPVYIPRNHRIEAAIASAYQDGNFAPFEELLEVLAAPFEDRTEFARYSDPPARDEIVRQTFCGT
jgi:serine/tyrosine/threonine adenylyltransferase